MMLANSRAPKLVVRLARGGPALAALLSAFALFQGCEEVSDALVDREVAGRVTDVRTGEPLAGARVVFTSDTLMSADATTGGDGRYEIAVTTDTPFGQVRAERTGYQPAEATVFFDTVARRVDLMLRPAPTM